MGYLGTKPANALATTEQIGDGAVQTADIANGAVTQAKLSTNVAGNGPAFSAYLNSAQSIGNSTFTKIQFNAEEYDTNSNFDTALYRFTPTVAGYYQISGGIRWQSVNATTVLSLYKNGSEWSRINESGTATVPSSYNTALIYFNGTTDYVELYVWQNTGSSQPLNLGVSTRFQGVLVRAA